MKIETIIFDLGNVLVNWDPAHLYKKIFPQEKEREHFLTTICTMDWHTEQDAGRSPQEGTAVLLQQYPEYEAPIRAFYDRWQEMFDGPIEGSVEILKELKSKGYPLYALSNWNMELYEQTVNDFPFLNWFDGKIISSEAKMKKPDAEIFQLLFTRFNINPETALFIDDNKDNAAAARSLGLRSILFTTPEALRNELETLQIL